jgi:hypothetical protein
MTSTHIPNLYVGRHVLVSIRPSSAGSLAQWEDPSMDTAKEELLQLAYIKVAQAAELLQKAGEEPTR